MDIRKIQAPWSRFDGMDAFPGQDAAVVKTGDLQACKELKKRHAAICCHACRCVLFVAYLCFTSKVICFEINSDASVTTLMLLLCFVVFHNTGARGKHKTCASKAPGHVPSQRLVRLHLFREWRIFQGTGAGSWLVVQARSRCLFRCSMKTMQILAYLHNFLSFSSPQRLIKTVVSNVTCFQWRVFGCFWRCCICPGSVGPVGTQEAARVSGMVGQVPIYGPINWWSTTGYTKITCEIMRNSPFTEVAWNHFIRFSARFSKDAGQNSSFGWLQKGMNWLVTIDWNTHGRVLSILYDTRKK